MLCTSGENLTEAAEIADRWKGCCEDLYHDEEGNGTEQKYWEQEPPPLRIEVARVIRQTASRKATGPDDVPAELFKAGGDSTVQNAQNMCGDLGNWWVARGMDVLYTYPTSKKGDLKRCENYRIIMLWFSMQARSFFGSYWKGSE